MDLFNQSIVIIKQNYNISAVDIIKNNIIKIHISYKTKYFILYLHLRYNNKFYVINEFEVFNINSMGSYGPILGNTKYKNFDLLINLLKEFLC